MERVMQPKTEANLADSSALLLMLAYVEAECRRLGAEAAARHAALAAALVQVPTQDAMSAGIALH
jgi:hypothetical protein